MLIFEKCKIPKSKKKILGPPSQILGTPLYQACDLNFELNWCKLNNHVKVDIYHHSHKITTF